MNEATARSACLPAFVAAVNLLSREVNFKLPLSLQSNKIQPRLNFSLFCGQSDDRRGLFQLSIEEGTKVLDGIFRSYRPHPEAEFPAGQPDSFRKLPGGARNHRIVLEIRTQLTKT